ncbi:hypothetical protein CLU79DRAFT_780911 [Phycomyces nitens]|nr:hypothetical protein CLU79DRAFT_780911 [Phycomyces nitens]
MLAHEDRTEKLTAVAKRKLQKYQTKKAIKTGSSESNVTTIEKENSDLRDQLKQAKEKIRHLESQMENNRLDDYGKDQFISNLLSDDEFDAYEQEERYIMENTKRRLYRLREKYSQTRAELCGNCLGDLLEI